jgi:UPF0042 nucleotide-binding protein
MKNLEFTIITGLSGAGRSEAIKCFEDMGYFCIDNFPPSLIIDMIELRSSAESKVDKIAVVSDVRGGEFFDTLAETLNELSKRKISYQILFLEASDEVLVKRFKETRRKHPLSLEGGVVDGIKKERHLMETLRGQADMIIDTSDLESFELRDKIRSSFLGKKKQKGILITVISFGYKYGIPLDADLVMDVRFLPNPHYVEELKPLSGLDEKVRNFIMKLTEAKMFLKKFTGLLAFLLPHYIPEGKTHFVVALGCTGGMHRSVVLAEEINKFLIEKGYNAVVKHRELG